MPSPDNEAAIRELQQKLDELKTEKGYGIGKPQDHIPAGAVPTTVKGWKKANTETVLELPSGNACKVKRPGLPELIKQGLIPDELTGFAQESIDNAQAGQREVNQGKIREIMSQADGIGLIVDAASRVTAACVLEPPVSFHKVNVADEGQPPLWVDIPEDKRDSNVLYTDEVDFNDLVFIFQFVVGGSRDLESFR